MVFFNKMKESDKRLNNRYNKICSICNKENIDLNSKYLKCSLQIKKFKDIMKYINPSEIIKKCFCINSNINNNNENGLYVHKYCILLKIIFNFEIKCEKCNTFYNIKIEKQYDKNKIIYLCTIFLIIYIIHLIIYLLCLFLIFYDKISKNNGNINYKHIIIVYSIILFIINSIILYFSIVKGIKRFRNIFKYKIDITDVAELNINNNKNKFYKLIYEYYKWFYDNSAKKLLIKIHKNFIINKGNYNNKQLNNYIKHNNLTEIELNNTKNENISQDNLIEKNNNINNLNNILTLKNNSKIENDNFNPFINIIPINNKDKDKPKENNNENIDDLYSDKTDNNEDNNNINNDIKNCKNKIFMTTINKKKTDFINININPLKANYINININIDNEVIEESSNKENTELAFNPTKIISTNIGKSALIPNKKNLMKKIMEDNNNYYQNYLKKRKQIRSIKLKHKNVKIKGTKIGDIEENEEVDFTEFEKGKMDSKISKASKFYFLKNPGSSGDLLKTKKSYLDVNLDMSNPTGSIANDELPNNGLNFKNNMVAKNANFNNSNVFQNNKK